MTLKQIFNVKIAFTMLRIALISYFHKNDIFEKKLSKIADNSKPIHS